MNRREFLKRLGVGLAAAATAKLAIEETTPTMTPEKLREARRIMGLYGEWPRSIHFIGRRV